MSSIKYIIVFFLLWRVFLFTPLYVGDKILQYRDNYAYTNIWKFTKPYQPVNSPLLYPHANFDGVHYLSIAGDGYINNGRFFPLYPLFIRFVSYFFGLGKTFAAPQFFSALIISNVLFLLSLIVFYKLVRLDFSDSVAKRTILYLLVFPTSFFLGSIYAESLFLLLTFLSFYNGRKGKWLWASFFGALLTATRIVGIAILPALCIELLIQNKRKPLKSILAQGYSLVLIPLGIVSFALFNYHKWGNLFRFVLDQGELSNGRSVNHLVFPLQTVVRYFKIFTTISPTQFEWWIALLELGTFFFVSILLYVGWKKGLRLSYLVFGLIAFLIPVLSGTFSGLPRYALLVFPIFITLGFIKSPVVKAISIAVSIILLFVLFILFSKGYYIA